MAAQLNDTVGIYPQQYEEKKMEERIQAILKERFGRDLDNCTKSEIFEALMVITKQEMAGRKRNTGNKKLYYISAEFLIGKLLSNNLINLGKAGRKRHMGIRPTVRGSVMNPNDHPHGGGEGRASIGRKAPMTPWGKKAMGVKTRKNKKALSSLARNYSYTTILKFLHESM